MGFAKMASRSTRSRCLPDDAVPLSQAARSIGQGLHVSTLHRWARKPLRRCPGVVLPVYAVGGRDFVSLRELRNFLAAIDARRARPPSRELTPRQLRRGTNDRRKEADELLDREGF